MKVNRSLQTIKNKWKNIKSNARRRDNLVKKSQNETGGGKLTRGEERIVKSNLLGDVATRLGVSARGSDARFDSDSNSVPPAPTNRTKRVFSMNDENTNMSMESSRSLASNPNDDGDFEMNFDTQTTTPLASTSKESDSPRKNVSGSSQKRKRNQRDVQNELMNENLQQHYSNLLQQNESTAFQNQYWKSQVEKAKITIEHEKLKMQLTEVEKQQSEKLMNVEIDKQSKLAAIEIEKQKEIAKMEIVAKRKQLGI